VRCAILLKGNLEPVFRFQLGRKVWRQLSEILNSQPTAVISTYNDSKALFLKIAMEVWAQHLAAAGRNSQKPADC